MTAPPAAARHRHAGLVVLVEYSAVRLIECEPGDLRMDLSMRVVYPPLRFPETPGEVMPPSFAPAVGFWPGLFMIPRREGAERAGDSVR